MALITCSECGSEISDMAASCPNCGVPVAAERESKPVKTKREGGAWEGIGFVAIVIGMIIGAAAQPPASTVGGVAALAGFVVFIIGRFK